MSDFLSFTLLFTAVFLAFALALSADLNRINGRVACEADHPGIKCVEGWIPQE